MATARQTAINSNPIVTPRRALHSKKSAAASEIKSSVQTKAKKPKNHLLYKNFRKHVSGFETTQALALMMQERSSQAQEMLIRLGSISG
jgi:hypothetical protein